MKKRIIITAAVVLGVAVFLLLAMFSTRNKATPWILDMNHLKQICLACQMYATDYAGAYPNDWAQLGPYLNDQAAFVADRNRQRTGALANVMRWTDYVYVPGNSKSSPADAIVAYLPAGFYPDKAGAAVVFADSHTEWMTVQELTRALGKAAPTTGGTARR